MRQGLTNNCLYSSLLFFNAFKRVINHEVYFCQVRLFKTLLRFYIASSLHVAISFLALFQQVILYYKLSLNASAYVLVFCVVITGYNFVKYGALIVRRKPFFLRPAIIVLSACASLIAGFLFVKEHALAQLLIAMTAGLALLYALPLYKNTGLRYVPVLKIILVAISWVLILFIYPLVSVHNVLAVNNLSGLSNIPFLGLRTLQYMLLIVALCIPFEIRDLKYDAQSLRTLPQLIGIKASKIIGIALLAGILLLEWQWGGSDLFLKYPAMLIICVTAVCIWLSDYVKSDYFTSFFVEAIPVMWVFLLYIATGL